ncbi:hypothetical protein M3G15_08570 [Paenibacillus sp. p3-SID1389]|uniref:hypothetical protein n=1 Tax=Paenibacillus sp. p3-SID1389 TaxID=2916364 RepID=UPI0021A81F6E|nr:hypothetical protein [Paenibacillus sp. p3-SID1389]MCT2195193.1 hypothetical protein [Paenibacillus sp. p3-SID1389]
MSEFVKPTIPAETADAIEAARRAGVNNATIIDVRNEDFIVEGVDRRSLQIIPFDTLLAALINGYEREMTDEELAHVNIRAHYDDAMRDVTQFAGRLAALTRATYADGIRFVLNELGVKIEGVNA